MVPLSRTSLRLIGLIVLGVVCHVLLHHHAAELAKNRRLPPKQQQAKQELAQAASHVPSTSTRAVGSEACRTGAPLSVLLIHEHHLKPIGSDVRLLGVVAQVRRVPRSVCACC